MRWDPFIRRQHFLDGAALPAKGVRTFTVQRLGFRMISEYVSYNPPSNVGMKMTEGSWFFERLGGVGGSARRRTTKAPASPRLLPSGGTTSHASPGGSRPSPSESAGSFCSATSTAASRASLVDAKTRLCSRRSLPHRSPEAEPLDLVVVATAKACDEQGSTGRENSQHTKQPRADIVTTRDSEVGRAGRSGSQRCDRRGRS